MDQKKKEKRKNNFASTLYEFSETSLESIHMEFYDFVIQTRVAVSV